jgi:hypothetical protein
MTALTSCMPIYSSYLTVIIGCIIQTLNLFPCLNTNPLRRIGAFMQSYKHFRQQLKRGNGQNNAPADLPESKQL